MQVSFFRTILKLFYPNGDTEIHSVYTRSKNIDKLKLLLYEQNISGFECIEIVNTEKITVKVPYTLLEQLNKEQN